jgi:hypothetical protein
MLQDTILKKYYYEIVTLIASHVAIKLCHFMIFLGWCLLSKG